MTREMVEAETQRERAHGRSPWLIGKTTMTRPEPPELTALRRSWREWTRIVDLHYRRRRARKQVLPEEYARLHKELTGCCQALAASDDPARQAFYGSLQGLAQPWLTLGTLERADREILLSLLNCCQAAEKQLHCAGRFAWLSHWLLTAFYALGACALLVLALEVVRRLDIPIVKHARDWSVRMLWLVQHLSDAERLIGLSILAALVAMYILSRLRRA